MCNKAARFPKTTLVLGAAVVTLLCLPCAMHAQSTTTQSGTMQSGATQTGATQDRTVQSTPDRPTAPTDDITRRDLARFDQFLDNHREIAEQLRKTPSLIDDPQFLKNHPELNTYLQDHPSVKEEISQRPDTFMRLEDQYAHDARLRDRDAAGQDTDNRDVANREPDRRDVADRDGDRGEVANFDRFLDGHREIAEQVRKDPSLLDNRNFVQNHPALQSYMQDHPGVRDQIRQDPNGFMRQEDALNRDSNLRDRDPMHDHMMDFGGWLHSHPDIQKDVAKDPSCVKDHDYMQNHAELVAYLNDHPDVRTELMANPQSFVHGAQQFGNGSPSGVTGGAGVSVHGTGTTGTGATGTGIGATGSMTGTSTNPATTHEAPKPNQ
jgi:hypothetical protein